MNNVGRITKAELARYNSTGQLPDHLVAALAADHRQRRVREALANKPKLKKDPLAKILFSFGVLGFPAASREYYFHDKVDWRFDAAWPTAKLALEYNGIHGAQNVGHASVGQLMRDYRKTTEAQLDGWIVILIDAASLRDGTAWQWIERAFKLRGLTCGQPKTVTTTRTRRRASQATKK